MIKPYSKVLFLDAEEEQDIEFLLPDTNEYHNIKITATQLTYRDNKLIDESYKLPIVCTFKPSSKASEYSCKRYFISKILHRIKLYLVRKYNYYFGIKTVKQLHLVITKTLDIFDSSKYTYELSCKLVVEYTKQNSIKYIEEFVFSSVSLLGEITLESTTTLPPVYWHCIKDYLYIPKNVIYNIKDNIISFTANGIKYSFDIDTKELNADNTEILNIFNKPKLKVS